MDLTLQRWLLLVGVSTNRLLAMTPLRARQPIEGPGLWYCRNLTNSLNYLKQKRANPVKFNEKPSAETDGFFIPKIV